MKTVEPTPPRRSWTRMLVALAYFTGVSLIVGWSLSDGVAADRPPGAAKRPAQPAKAVPPPSKPAAEAAKALGRVSCAGCGVIESVQRVDTPVVVMDGCHAGERAGIAGRLHNAGGPDASDTLADTVASVIADGRGRKKVALSTRHQIVVRFRDGSRQVFDEATPRSLRVGDRIVVIAGTGEAKGAPRVPTTGRLAANGNGDPWRSVRSRTDG